MSEIKRTDSVRGFSQFEFEDTYGLRCTLQKSSSAMEDKIWLGVHDADPQITAHDARRLGLACDQNYGWVPYHVPEEVLMHTRMHLNQKQVRDLLPFLIHFADTGELPQE